MRATVASSSRKRGQRSNRQAAKTLAVAMDSMGRPRRRFVPRASREESRDPDYGYAWLTGTSMAAPQVAGAAALVKSLNPDWNPNQVRQRLKRTARDGPADKTYYGAGVLDTLAAVEE